MTHNLATQSERERERTLIGLGKIRIFNRCVSYNLPKDRNSLRAVLQRNGNQKSSSRYPGGQLLNWFSLLNAIGPLSATENSVSRIGHTIGGHNGADRISAVASLPWPALLKFNVIWMVRYSFRSANRPGTLLNGRLLSVACDMKSSHKRVIRMSEEHPRDCLRCRVHTL